SSKQYCGDVEADPFDFAYRGSVFDPYKDPNKVPTVEEHERFSDTEDLIEDVQLPAHRLSAKVRHQYLYYLERVLRKNYHTWLSSYSSNHKDDPFTDDELRQCAEAIEMRAVQACMITSLYRNFILQKIGEIRKQTTLGLMHHNLTDVKFKPACVKREQCHVGVQTDPIIPSCASFAIPNARIPLVNVPAISLEEKMEIFQRKHATSEYSSYGESNAAEPADEKHVPCISTPVVQIANKSLLEPIPPIGTVMEGTRPRNDAMDDEIMKELQAMFQPDEDEEVNIFEWSEDQAQVKAIINETENVEPLLGQGQCARASTAPSSPKIDRKALLPEQPQRPRCSEPADLRCSMWPCELHMQRMKLRTLLVKLAEDNYRRYEQLVQTQFVTLFGEDDGEEQDLGPYSPSIELNEVLVSSCRQRIAKWVVQSLMRPLNDGLIGNRFLFKKLAKRMADGIIHLNQYPDKKFIRNYIDDYFCAHAQINSIEDIT
uniref:Uncharacterized protein n=1 Tax=Anopheles epiroticus TaxID=199890 RepID=A0A182P0C3_9DIPT